MSFKKYIIPIILILCLAFSLSVYSTAWDVSTASYDGKYKDVSSEDEAPRGVFFKPDGSKMYVMGTSNDTVYQYSMAIVAGGNAINFGANF